MPDFIAKKKLFVCEKAKSNRTEVYAEPIEIYAEPVEIYAEPVEAKSNRAETKGEAFAKISSVVALQARSDKRKSESLGGKSNRVEVKSNRVESAIFHAIRFFFCAM